MQGRRRFLRGRPGPRFAIRPTLPTSSTRPADAPFVRMCAAISDTRPFTYRDTSSSSAVTELRRRLGISAPPGCAVYTKQRSGGKRGGYNRRAMSVALWILASVGIFLLLVLIHDLTQTRHAILRNFPIIGHLRYILEAFGPELRQYIVTGNDEERPFSRDQRRWVYASSKKE